VLYIQQFQHPRGSGRLFQDLSQRYPVTETHCEDRAQFQLWVTGGQRAQSRCPQAPKGTRRDEFAISIRTRQADAVVGVILKGANGRRIMDGHWRQGREPMAPPVRASWVIQYNFTFNARKWGRSSASLPYIHRCPVSALNQPPLASKTAMRSRHRNTRKPQPRSEMRSPDRPARASQLASPSGPGTAAKVVAQSHTLVTAREREQQAAARCSYRSRDCDNFIFRRRAALEFCQRRLGCIEPIGQPNKITNFGRRVTSKYRGVSRQNRDEDMNPPFPNRWFDKPYRHVFIKPDVESNHHADRARATTRHRYARQQRLRQLPSSKILSVRDNELIT